MRPKVQMSEIMTVPSGTKTPRARLNEASSTSAMTNNVIGGSRKKSDRVYEATASETFGLPI
jgi:hypothetical protein